MNPFNSNQSVPMWKLVFVFSIAIGLTIVVINGALKKKVPGIKSANEQEAPPDLEQLYSSATLVSEGEFVIFGTNRPELEISLSGKFDRMPIGKGKCAFCHLFVEGHKQDRCPDLRGLEQRAHNRPQEDRYKMFSAKYAEAPEPDSGFKPNARTGGEYIIESIYCPNCYVVEGFGIPGSDDLRSEMPVMNHMPYELSDYEIIAVAAYLQTKDTPGDFSKITAVKDWQNYFKKARPLPDNSPKVFASIESLEETEKLTHSIEGIIKKNGCFICHKIPGIAIAKTGLIGPILAMKNTAGLRLSSPEYRLAFSEGRAKARTEREYVMESILEPAAFILPGFGTGEGMPLDYSRKMTLGEVEKLVDYLLTIDESKIKEEGLLSPVGLDEKPDPVQ